MSNTNNNHTTQDGVTFDARHTYLIGVMRPGHTPDSHEAELQNTGRFKAKKLLGSQLIANGVRVLDDLFRDNPFGLSEGRTYDVFELNVDTESRRYMGGGTVLPKAKVVSQVQPAAETVTAAHGAATQPEKRFEMVTPAYEEPAHDVHTPEVSASEPPALNDESDAKTVIPLFEAGNDGERRTEGLGRVHRNLIETLRDELEARGNVIDRAHRIAEQALTQNERMWDRFGQALEELTKAVHQRDETAYELAQVKAEVNAILQVREFEERMRKEREEERREREEERRQELEERSQGLGDSIEKFIPLMPLIQMLLERVWPAPGGFPQGGGAQGGFPYAASPQGVPANYGGSFGVPPGGMPSNGMPLNGIPMQGMPHPSAANGGVHPSQRPMQPSRGPVPPGGIPSGAPAESTHTANSMQANEAAPDVKVF